MNSMNLEDILIQIVLKSEREDIPVSVTHFTLSVVPEPEVEENKFQLSIVWIQISRKRVVCRPTLISFVKFKIVHC